MYNTFPTFHCVIVCFEDGEHSVLNMSLKFSCHKIFSQPSPPPTLKLYEMNNLNISNSPASLRPFTLLIFVLPLEIGSESE
mmetsp:Transcript_7022/g.26284  ORF Transcript_7022/g.26284 Transcript_7022/m.26284 type:complete len:81 (-) Transcript_7022:22-264(-)